MYQGWICEIRRLKKRSWKIATKSRSRLGDARKIQGRACDVRYSVFVALNLSGLPEQYKQGKIQYFQFHNAEQIFTIGIYSRFLHLRLS